MVAVMSFFVDYGGSTGTYEICLCVLCVSGWRSARHGYYYTECAVCRGEEEEEEEEGMARKWKTQEPQPNACNVHLSREARTIRGPREPQGRDERDWLPPIPFLSLIQKDKTCRIYTVLPSTLAPPNYHPFHPPYTPDILTEMKSKMMGMRMRRWRIHWDLCPPRWDHPSTHSF